MVTGRIEAERREKKGKGREGMGFMGTHRFEGGKGLSQYSWHC
jgi:hypothetical protein